MGGHAKLWRGNIQVHPEPNGERPEVDGKVATPTTFELSRRWQSAVDGWRTCLFVQEGPSARLLLTIPRTPTEDDSSTAACYCTDPSPKRKVLQRLAAEPGLQAFVLRTTDLADATKAVLPILKRHKEPAEHATALLLALRRRPGRPSVDDHERSWRLQRQLESIHHCISQGVLPPEEDLPEREAFWNDMLSDLRTRSGLTRLTSAVENILSCQRNPDHELALLNGFAAEGDRELRLLALEPIRLAKGSDCLSVCRRWRDLVAVGIRCFSRHQPGGEQAVVRLADLARVRRMREDSDLPLELEWAGSLRDATESIRPLAEDAGFTASDRLAISEMARNVTTILEGKPIDLRASAAAVELLVDEIVAKAKSNRRPSLERLHQLVINVRDNITRLLGLLSYQTLGHDLMLLDHYVKNAESGDSSGGPGRADDIEWRALASCLLADLGEATSLSNQEFGDPARSLRHDLVLSGQSQATFAMLSENSFHTLVLVVARVIVEPESPGSVPQAALDSIGPGPNGKPLPGVVRRRVVQEMLRSKWPADTSRELEREYAQTLTLPPGSQPVVPVASSERAAQAPVAENPPFMAARSLMTGKAAAGMVGVSPGTISRWRAKVPAWARDEKLLFRDLLDSENGSLRRDKVLRLKRWFEAAQADGGQRPVACP